METKNRFPSASWWLNSWILKDPLTAFFAKVVSILCLLASFIIIIAACQFASLGSMLEAAVTLSAGVLYMALGYLFNRFSRFIYHNRRH